MSSFLCEISDIKAELVVIKEQQKKQEEFQTLLLKKLQRVIELQTDRMVTTFWLE